MIASDLARQRLFNQHLAGAPFATPAEVVQWLGAVQAQDYAAAKWGIGLRAAGISDAAVDRALAEGSIIRTHVMRPTWHFVVPADLRWLLELTAPRVHGLNAYYYRQLGLDDAVFGRSNAALRKALAGGKELTRTEIARALNEAGIPTAGVPLRFGYLLMRAELDMVICSGGRRGKQFTYALFDERVPQTRRWSRDEAMGELARRFFRGHGPATLKDVFWPGLSAADAKASLEIAKGSLGSEVINGKTFWFGENVSTTGAVDAAFLIPAYDEYFIAYHDYDALALDPRYREEVSRSAGQTILIDGQIVGTWKRTLKRDSAVINLRPFRAFTAAEMEAIEAAERYGRFLVMPVTVAPQDVSG